MNLFPLHVQYGCLRQATAPIAIRHPASRVTPVNDPVGEGRGSDLTVLDRDLACTEVLGICSFLLFEQHYVVCQMEIGSVFACSAVKRLQSMAKGWIP